MKLTEDQTEEFYTRYIDRYGLTEDLPILPIAKKEEEEKEWKEFIEYLLGNKANKLYKYRPRGRETVKEKVFNSLRLMYGPSFIDEH